MATSWLACLAEPDKWIVPCVKWLDWVVDSEFTRFHGLDLQQGSSGAGHAGCNESLYFLSSLFFWEENFCLPILTVMVALRVLLSALFSLWWFATREHVEIINFKPCQTHFPHMHGVHHPPSPRVFTLPSETLARRVPKKPDNPVLLSRNQKSPCGFVTVGTRATLLQITKSV